MLKKWRCHVSAVTATLTPMVAITNAAFGGGQTDPQTRLAWYDQHVAMKDQNGETSSCSTL